MKYLRALVDYLRALLGKLRCPQCRGAGYVDQELRTYLKDAEVLQTYIPAGTPYLRYLFLALRDVDIHEWETIEGKMNYVERHVDYTLRRRRRCEHGGGDPE